MNNQYVLVVKMSGIVPIISNSLPNLISQFYNFSKFLQPTFTVTFSDSRGYKSTINARALQNIAKQYQETNSVTLVDASCTVHEYKGLDGLIDLFNSYSLQFLYVSSGTLFYHYTAPVSF